MRHRWVPPVLHSSHAGPPVAPFVEVFRQFDDLAFSARRPAFKVLSDSSQRLQSFDSVEQTEPITAIDAAGQPQCLRGPAYPAGRRRCDFQFRNHAWHRHGLPTTCLRVFAGTRVPLRGKPFPLHAPKAAVRSALGTPFFSGMRRAISVMESTRSRPDWKAGVSRYSSRAAASCLRSCRPA